MSVLHLHPAHQGVHPTHQRMKGKAAAQFHAQKRMKSKSPCKSQSHGRLCPIGLRSDSCSAFVGRSRFDLLHSGGHLRHGLLQRLGAFPAPASIMPVAAELREGGTCVFMTKGPCCTTGSPMGRPAASRKRSPSPPALAATWSPGPSTSACN